MFVVPVEGSVAAVAVISADPHIAEPGVGRLRSIYVRRDLRGRSFAGTLVRVCLARAGKRWRRIRLHTGNSVAARLYARHGFEPVEEVRATHALVVASWIDSGRSA